jgi:hypothetical protein
VEFAVVVVLDDRRTNYSCESQQLLSSINGHQQTGGVLMGRGDENKPRLITAALEREATVVEPDTTNDGSGGFKSRVRSSIAGTFEPRDVACVEQNPANEFYRRLSRRRDDDLSRFGPDAPMLDQMSEQRSL